MVEHQQLEPAPLTAREPIVHSTRLRMTFLQLGEVHAHRSVLYAKESARMTKGKRIYATTLPPIVHLEPTIDDTEHVVDPELVTMSEDEIKMWGFLMTQYNLKPGLWKFGVKGVCVCVSGLRFQSGVL